MSDLKLEVLDNQSQSIFRVHETSGTISFGTFNVNNTEDSQSITQGGAVTVLGGLSVSKTFRSLYSNVDYQTIGNVLIQGNLTVLGQTNVESITTSNQIEENVTTTTLYITNSLNSSQLNTIGNLFTNGLNIGIGSTNSQNLLEILGTAPNVLIGTASTSASTIGYSNNFLTVNTGISSASLYTVGITAENINFTGNLYKNESLYISSQWSTNGYDLFYTAGNIGINTTSPTALLTVSGGNTLNSTTGSVVVYGGLGVTQDVHIAGDLFVNNTKIQTFTGNVTIGSFNNSGAYQVIVPVSTGTTAYNVIGNLSTISTVPNLYTVSFYGLESSQFIANIYRIDALGSGWIDPDLNLGYSIVYT